MKSFVFISGRYEQPSIASMQENDQNRLTTFFDEEYFSLKAYVRSRIDDTSERDAEDIVQDVAVRIFSRPGDATPITNIAGFVYNAIRNRIVDLMRTNKRKIIRT